MANIIFELVSKFFYIYSMLLVIYALMSWLPGARESQFGRIINRLVQPYLDIFDRLIPSVGGISFNVIIAIFVLQFVEKGVLFVLVQILNLLK